MADTVTTTLGLTKPEVGASEDSWGEKINTNFDLVDDALDGTTAVSLDINGGTIDGAVIGGATPAAGTFTTLTANTSLGGTLSTAAQPNVTSVGTLTGLTVSASASLAGASTTADITFGDNDKAIFGAGSDLQIYHDAGGDSYITESNASGQLRIQAGNIKIADADGNNFIYMTDLGTGGLVNLFHNGSEKLATTATGIAVTGNATFADNGKAIFGAGSDLQIYHDGSNSYIEDTATGSLILKGADVVVKDSSNNDIAKFLNGGAAQLRYAGATKLATTSTGIDVTGTVTADGLTVDTATQVTLGAAGVTNGVINCPEGLYINIDSDNNQADTREFRLGKNGTGFVSSLLLNITENGDVRFYEDTGTTAKFFWDASAESLGIGTSSTDGKLKISATSGGSNAAELTLYGNNGGAYGYGNVARSKIASQSAGDAFGANLLFYTNDSSNAYQERMRIDSSGNVGIGVVPDTWAGTGAAIQLDGTGHVATANQYAYFGSNYYYNSGWKYTTSSTAAQYRQDSGTHQWLTAASGTADAALTWSEAMRIDSSGNLLVGKTSAGYATDGFEARASGYASVSDTSSTPFLVNRNTDDGSLISFYKNGSPMGSISTLGGDFAIGSSTGSGAGLRMAGSSNVIYASNASGNARDAAIDLGASSVRWKDLYLSGGVYLGGTGAANKLDDYELGYFSPTITRSSSNPTVTYTTTSTFNSYGTGIRGRYVVIGTKVFCEVDIRFSAITGGGGTYRISNLPFAATSGYSAGVVSEHTSGFTYSSYSTLNFEVQNGGSIANLILSGSGLTSTVLSSISDHSGYIIGSFSYTIA